MDYYYDDYEMNYGNVPKRLKILYKAGSDDFYDHVPEFKTHDEYTDYDKCTEYSDECYVDTIRNTLKEVFETSLPAFIKVLDEKRKLLKNNKTINKKIKDIQTRVTNLQNEYTKNDYLNSEITNEAPLMVEGTNLHLCASRLPKVEGIIDGNMTLSDFKSAINKTTKLRNKVEGTIQTIEKDQKTILQTMFELQQNDLRVRFKKPYKRARKALDKKENEYIKLGKKLLKLKSEKNVYKEIQSKQHIINKLVDKVFAEAAEAETGQRFEPELPIKKDPVIQELFDVPKIENDFNQMDNENANNLLYQYAINKINFTPTELFLEFKSLGLYYGNKKDLFEEIIETLKLVYQDRLMKYTQLQREQDEQKLEGKQFKQTQLERLEEITKTFINLIKFYPIVTYMDSLTLSKDKKEKEEIKNQLITYTLHNINIKKDLHKLQKIIHPDQCFFSQLSLKISCDVMSKFLTDNFKASSFGSALGPYIGKRKQHEEMSLVEAPESTIVEYSPEQKKAKKQKMTELTEEYRQLFATQKVQKTLDALGEELRSNIMTIVKKGKTPQERNAKKKMLLKLVKKSPYGENMFYNFKKYRWRKIARPFTNTGKKIYNNYVAIINNIFGNKKEKWQPKYETIEYVDYNENLELILSTEPNKIQKEIKKMEKQIQKINDTRYNLLHEVIPEFKKTFDDARENYIDAYQDLVGFTPTLDKSVWRRILNLRGQYDIVKFDENATFSEQYRDPLQIPFKKIIGQLTGVKYCLKLLVGSSGLFKGSSEYKKGFMGLVLWLIKNKGKPIPEEPEYESLLPPPPEAAIVPFHSADVEELVEEGFEQLKSNGIIENQLKKIRNSDCNMKGCFRANELESLQGLFSLPGLIYSNMQLWMSCNEGCRQFFNDLFIHLHKHKGCFDSLTRDQLLYRKNENGRYEFKIQKQPYKNRKGRFNKGISSENCMKQMLENGFLNEYLLGNHTLTSVQKNEYNKFWLSMYCEANGIRCKNMVKCSKNTKKQLRKDYPELQHLLPIKYWEM